MREFSLGLSDSALSLKKYTGGIFTQVILSANSFVIAAWIAKACNKGEFGLYSVAINTVYIFMSLQNALVSSPLTVMLPEQQGRDRDILVFGLGTGQLLVVFPAVLLLSAVAFVYSRFISEQAQVYWVFALLLTIPAAWTREYIRVLHFSNLHIRRVIAMDITYVLLTLLGLLILERSNSMKADNVMLLIGCAYLISAVSGFRSSVILPAGSDLRWICTAFSRAWKHSRWALVGIVASSLQTNGHIYLVSAMIGLEGTADISASRMLLVPYGLLISSSQRIFLACGSLVKKKTGTRGLSGFIVPFLAFFTCAWIAYMGLLALFQNHLILLFFNNEYLNIAGYFPLWSALFLVTSWRFVVTYSLQVLLEFKTLALYGIISSVTVLAFTLPLIRAAGVAGMILSLILGENVLLLLSLPKLISEIKKKATS